METDAFGAEPGSAAGVRAVPCAASAWRRAAPPPDAGRRPPRPRPRRQLPQLVRHPRRPQRDHRRPRAAPRARSWSASSSRRAPPPTPQTELARILRELRTDYVDVLTFYYVEEAAEWQQIIGPGGALEYCRGGAARGSVRRLGVTSHQRPLAAEMARSGLLDLLMIRYNAAHRGAETRGLSRHRALRPAGDRLHLPALGRPAAADAGRPAGLRRAAGRRRGIASRCSRRR